MELVHVPIFVALVGEVPSDLEGNAVGLQFLLGYLESRHLLQLFRFDVGIDRGILAYLRGPEGKNFHFFVLGQNWQSQFINVDVREIFGRLSHHRKGFLHACFIRVDTCCFRLFIGVSDIISNSLRLIGQQIGGSESDGTV